MQTWWSVGCLFPQNILLCFPHHRFGRRDMAWKTTLTCSSCRWSAKRQSWQDQSWVEYAWNVILSCDLCVWCHFCSSCLNFQVVFLSHLKTLALSMSSKHQELSCNPAQPSWFRNWMVSKTTAIYSNLYQCILYTSVYHHSVSFCSLNSTTIGGINSALPFCLSHLDSPNGSRHDAPCSQ